jgi:signal transduction histidine kinase/DNA-binding response OmpR family regulator
MLRNVLLPLVAFIGVAALVVGAAPAEADDTVPYRHYTVQDGLPQASILALAQSPDRRLWIGTRAGLAVYDGHDIRSVALSDSLAGTAVVDLRASALGTVWAALSGTAIVAIRNGTVQRALPAPSRTNGVARLVVRNDTLLAVTTKALWVLPPGADRFDRHPYDYPVRTGAPLPDAPTTGYGVTDAALGPDGTVWVLDKRRGPGRLALDGSVRFADAALRQSSDGWRRLSVDRSGALLLAGGRGAVHYVPSTGRSTVLDTRWFSEAHSSGTARYGLHADQVVQWTAADTTVFGPAQGLPDVLYQTVLEDRSGSVWIGTESGLLHLPAPQARYTQHLAGTDLRWMTSFGVDRTRGELWVASWGRGLFRLRPRPTRHTPQDVNQWTFAVSGPDTSLYCVGHHGWLRRRGDGWAPVNETLTAIRGVVQRAGTGLFWTDDGLVQAPPSRETVPDTLWHWPRPDRGYHNFALAADGTVLLRSHGVLMRRFPEAPARADTLATFPAYKMEGGTSMVRLDEKVYLGLNRRGVLRIDLGASPPAVDLVVEKGGVEQLNAIGDSLLVAGTNRGVHVLDARTGRVQRRLTTADGLATNDVYAAQLYGDTLYTTHTSGVSKLPRRVLRGAPSPPTTRLTRWSVKDASRPLADSVRLDAHERTVSFDFTGVHLTRGPDVQYAYRLVPYDTTWTPTEQSFTRYTDLPPGTYRFEARARLAGGPVGAPARLTFTVPRAYYETGWFQALLAGGLLLLVGGAYLWRTRTLRRRQDQLRRLVDERTERLAAEKRKTEEQARRLEAIDEEKSRFFANISHELRTPITVLQGGLQDVLDGAFGDIPLLARRQLEIMRSNVQRLRRLTDQLLDLARLEAADPELEPEPGDLVATLRRLTRRFAPLAERQGVQLDLDTAVEAHPCRFDPEKIDKVASNLISNALAHTPEGGRVTVRLDVEPGDPPTAVLNVTDTGRGIPPEKQDAIFERFARADETDDQSGTGIGLALAREFVELHGGTISVESPPGEGSTFTVRLPLPPADPDAGSSQPAGGGVGEAAPAAAEDEVASSDDARLPEGSPVGDGAPRSGAASDPGEADETDRPMLLVVEDNDDVRAYLRRHLADAYRVVEATDGAEGWAKARDADPDLILADLMMPGLDGIELCRRVRGDDALARTPFVLLTARAAEEDAVAGLEAGADAYVTKPFSTDELKARLRRLLEAHWAGTPDGASVARFTPEVDVSSDDEDLLDRVTDAIDQHLAHADFTVDDLAAKVGLSPRQLQRRLKQLTGTSPAAFIRQYRLDVGAQLLEQDGGTVAQVAYQVGFGTPDTFSRHFKDRFGCPPSAYPEDADDTA